MLIRTLLLALFFISSALSVCVAETALLTPDKTITMETPALPTPDTAKTMEDALKCVTISTEDWLDGDTYYIRYTFTNPTAVAIDKKVDLTTVRYERCSIINEKPTIIYDIPDNELSLVTTGQCSTALKRLVIAPYSTETVTLVFSQHRPTSFNQVAYTTFFFSDDTQLVYSQDIVFEHMYDTPFLLYPWISTDHELYLTIRNTSFFKTISQIDNLCTTLFPPREYRVAAANKKAITVDIPPQESKTLYLFTLPDELLTANDKSNPTYQSHLSFSQNFDVPLTLDIQIALRLNHIPHFYNGAFTADSPFATLVHQASPKLPQTDYYTHLYNAPSLYNCFYYLDDAYLYGYLQLTNYTDTTITESNAQYDLLLTYFTHDTYSHSANIVITLPPNFTLDVNESKYFSFRIPLPTDCYQIEPTQMLRLYANWQTPPHQPTSFHLMPRSIQLLPVAREAYLPITAEYCPLAE